MGIPMPTSTPYYYNILEQDIKKSYQPYFYTFRTLIATPAGATDVVRNNVTYRDFIWTDLGFTTDAAFGAVWWFPNIGVPFRVQIRDINANVNFGNQRFDLTSIIGSNPQWNDKVMYKLPVPWRFLMNTTIEVEFENIGLVPSFPTLTLGGFYSNTAR